MRNEVEIENPLMDPPAEDARALLARLYREIGVSAVAAALEIHENPREKRRPSVKDIPAVFRDDKAA